MLEVHMKASLAMLPQLPGVFGLSNVEIKKDLREMMRDLAVDEDTDGSVKSDDILTSSYPVRPRKTPRRDRGSLANSYSTIESADYNSMATQVDLDEKLKYIASVEQEKNEIVHIDQVREERDVHYQSLVDARSRYSKDFLIDKKLHENYYKVLQSLHIRTLQLRATYIIRNIMVLDTHTTIKLRTQALEDIKSEVKPGETNVLRVTLAPSDRKFAFYKGQHLLTPMGEGKVAKILPFDKKLEIHLPFGVLYSSVSSVVSWNLNRRGGIDVLSDEYLINKWSSIQGSFNAPHDYGHRLRNLVELLRGEEGETDGDEGDEHLPGSEATVMEHDKLDSLEALQEVDARANINYIMHREMHHISPDIFPYVFTAPSKCITIMGH
jgi:hypothetical protein